MPASINGRHHATIKWNHFCTDKERDYRCVAGVHMRLAKFAYTMLLALGAGCSGDLDLLRAARPGSSGDGANQNNRSPAATSTGTKDGTATDPTTSADGSDDAADPDSGAAGETDGAGEGPVTGFELVEPILEKYCTRCHNPDGDNPDLTSYSRARIVGQHIVRTSAADIPAMPLGTAKLTDSEKATLRAWRAGGFAK